MTTRRPNTSWTAEQINELPVEQHFRMRGIDTTRLDTLVDAAFAFTLTMLAIAEGGVPTSFDEIIEGLLQLPALLISFAVLMIFWFGHRKWSRRYGIENTFTVVVSATMVFMLLVYIYPLRLIFEGMISFLSGDLIPCKLEFTGYNQVRGFFAFYAAGFLAMSLLMTALYFSATRHASSLMLDDFERMETNIELHQWIIAVAFSVISILLAITVPIQFVSASGFIFFGMMVFSFVHTRRYRRRMMPL